MRWGKASYSELYSAWVHIKAVRTFAEAVLRYGLPVDFQAILLKVSHAMSSKSTWMFSSTRSLCLYFQRYFA